MKQLNKILNMFEENFTVVCFIAMIIIVNLAVLFRYVIKTPLPWGEEAARYIMVWGVFVGVSIGVRKRVHLGVEAFVNPFSPKFRGVIVLASQLIRLAALVLFAYLAIKLTANIKGNGQTAPAMGIPMYLAYAAVPVGLILSTIRQMQVVWADYMSKSEEETNP